MRSLGLVLAGVAGCYAPTVPVGNPCDPAAPVCPSGQACLASDNGYVCSLGGGGGADAATDAGSDGPTTDGNALCFGTGTVRDICVAATPTNTLTISSVVTIDTAMVGGANCTTIVAQPSGPSLCVVAAGSIAITPSGVLGARGANPLVLLAEDSIDIAGTLDVSSHRMNNVMGAGARATCGGGVNGATANAPPQGGGGGAGGSFAGAGAAGGQGRTGTAGGTPTNASAPAVLTGGCAGGNGGAGGNNGGGQGGRGFATGMNPGAGGNGSNDFCGGGGGGGGAGAVRVFGVPPASIGGMVSPPPT